MSMKALSDNEKQKRKTALNGQFFYFGTMLPKNFSKHVQKYHSQPQRYAIMVLSAK